MRNIGIIAQKHFYAYKGIDSSLVYTNADVEDFRDGVYLGYHISLVALIPVLMQAIAGIMPSGSMTAQIKVQGLNGYQYNATVEISGSAGGVSAGDIGAGLLIQQVTGSGSAKDNDKGDSDAKNVNDILDGAEETTRPVGKAKNYEKGGGYEQALKDFESLKPVKSKDIVTSYGNGKYGVLEDGTTVSVRPGSKTGGSTLEIHVPGKSLIKIRY
jgi:hypothetical protein